MEVRALGYQMLLWSTLRAGGSGIVPNDNRLRIVYLRHIDAAAAIASRPAGLCGWSDGVKVADVEKMLRSVPTRFKIDPSCHGPLMRRAAVELVNANADRIRGYFRRIANWPERLMQSADGRDVPSSASRSAS